MPAFTLSVHCLPATCWSTAPAQVLPLSPVPDDTLADDIVLRLKQWTRDPTVAHIRMLVGGGDGTLGWAISVAEAVLEGSGIALPPMALLPLGTGNELSRCLGWGATASVYAQSAAPAPAPAPRRARRRTR